MGGLIAAIHQALSGLDNAEPAPGPLVPAVLIRQSIQPEYVVCLECGFRAQTLRRHLRTMHGFEPTSYRARWKLASDHPLTAPAYSARRSAMAKQAGLGRNRAADAPAGGRSPVGE